MPESVAVIEPANGQKRYTPFTVGNAYGRQERDTTPITEARTLQRILFASAKDEKTGPLALAALARAWCTVQDCVREMRGIPLAGQLRPEGLPNKRARVRSSKQAILEMKKAFAEAGVSEAQPSEPTQAQPPKVAKESL